MIVVATTQHAAPPISHFSCCCWFPAERRYLRTWRAMMIAQQTRISASAVQPSGPRIPPAAGTASGAPDGPMPSGCRSMASACPATKVAVNMAEAAKNIHSSQRHRNGWDRPSGNSRTVSAASTAMPNSPDSAITATGPKGSVPWCTR